MNIYAPKKKPQKYKKQLTVQKGEIYNSIHVIEGFNIIILEIDKISRLKVRKDTDQNNAIKKLKLLGGVKITTNLVV